MTRQPSIFKYGSQENVSLTMDEMVRLIERFTESGATDRIETFSLQKAAHGYKYKSDMAAILAWDRMEQKRAAKVNSERIPKHMAVAPREDWDAAFKNQMDLEKEWAKMREAKP